VGLSKIWDLIIHKKALLLNIYRLIISVLLLYFLIKYIHPAEIKEAFLKIDLLFLFFGILAFAVHFYSRFIVWKIICSKHLGINENSTALKSLLGGYASGITTPLRVGDFLGRVIMLDHKKAADITAATSLDRVIPYLVLFFAGGIMTQLYLVFFMGLSVVYFFLILAATLLYGYFIYKITLRRDFIRKYYTRLYRFEMMKQFLDSLRALKLLGKKLIEKLFLITFISFLFNCLEYAFLMAAFSGDYDFHIYMLGIAAVFFTKSFIPVAFGEVGVREGLAVFYFSQVGIHYSAAFNSAVMLFIINIALPALIGGYLVLRKKK